MACESMRWAPYSGADEPMRRAPSNAELNALWESPAGNDEAVSGAAWAKDAWRPVKQYAPGQGPPSAEPFRGVSQWEGTAAQNRIQSSWNSSESDRAIFDAEHNREW
jgi:hypothetical protein